MRKKRASVPPSVAATKVRTGIDGLDTVTGGGLPNARATLVLGGPGSGKTLLGLQSLVHGAQADGEAGVFVAFEESPERIVSNAASFGWDLPSLQRRLLHFVDARPSIGLMRAGDFDLTGTLAVLEAKVRKVRARRIVLDSLDMLFALMPDESSVRREALRLHEWLLDQQLSSVLTCQVPEGIDARAGTLGGGFLQFMVDCAIIMHHRVHHGVSQRALRVLKYRGSSFAENEIPVVIGDRGIDVALADPHVDVPATTERLSSGVPRLDTMLGGGYFRGAGILVTGAPGAAKTTLAGAFTEAACGRGESTLFVSFDSSPQELTRNMASVGIRLERYRRRGLLRIVQARSEQDSAEVHFLRIRSLASEHRVRCLVIDPVSALAKRFHEDLAYGVVERLAEWAKTQGITLFNTSLTQSATPELEATPLDISTIADTWIHLSFRVQSGERNRAITIIKSRGTRHSSQVRELLLDASGVTLADVFTTGGEVLMGTLRWEREEEARSEQQRRAAESTKRLAELSRVEADIVGRLRSMEQELEATRAQRRAAEQETLARESGVSDRRQGTGKLRQADSPSPRTGGKS